MERDAVMGISRVPGESFNISTNENRAPWTLSRESARISHEREKCANAWCSPGSAGKSLRGWRGVARNAGMHGKRDNVSRPILKAGSQAGPSCRPTELFIRMKGSAGDRESFGSCNLIYSQTNERRSGSKVATASFANNPPIVAEGINPSPSHRAHTSHASALTTVRPRERWYCA